MRSRAASVRAAQSSYLLEKLQDTIENYGAEAISGVFVCGDFNDSAQSDCVKLLAAPKGDSSSLAPILEFDHAYSNQMQAEGGQPRVSMATPQVSALLDFVRFP